MAFTADTKAQKLRAWAVNHPEYGTFTADLERRWRISQVGDTTPRWDCATKKTRYATLAAAQSITLAGSHFADHEQSFWTQYTPPTHP